jgi:hypothetical protein
MSVSDNGAGHCPQTPSADTEFGRRYTPFEPFTRYCGEQWPFESYVTKLAPRNSEHYNSVLEKEAA